MTDKPAERRTRGPQVKTEMNKLKKSLAEQEVKTDKILTMLESMAKNNPVIISKRDETEEHQIGHERERKLSSVGPAESALESRVNEAIDTRGTMSKAAMLAFMEEEMVIVVADSTNKNDVPVPTVWNDGRAAFFVRNQKTRVKRKYVEVLARLKYTTYTQRQVRDAQGNDTYINVPHTALLYPFSVVHDPSGQKGADWLDRVLQEN